MQWTLVVHTKFRQAKFEGRGAVENLGIDVRKIYKMGLKETE
jgi:hypothetical protein